MDEHFRHDLRLARKKLPHIKVLQADTEVRLVLFEFQLILNNSTSVIGFYHLLLPICQAATIGSNHRALTIMQQIVNYRYFPSYIG